MARSVRLFLSRQGAPRAGSVGAVNAAFAEALARLGCRVEPFPDDPPGIAERFLPLGRAKRQSRLAATSPLDAAIYDDAGLALCPPSRRWARRNAVFYHGLAWNPGAWLGNPELDLHCANSAYLASVLRSILAYPDWGRRTCLEPRAFRIVADLVLALPLLERPGGALMPFGSEVPAAVRRALESGDAWGHALQAEKHDWVATLGILARANELARERGTPALRLLVPEGEVTARELRAVRETLGAAAPPLEDYVLPVPRLRQAALFELMRACRFALAYNLVPESFGFQVLESVWHGCPVYTNGAGNMRHVLPPEHGIAVLESWAPADDPADWSAVAERLLEDLARPTRIAEQCRRGAAFIGESFNRHAFEASVAAALDRLDREPGAGPAFEDLVIRIGPLVRRCDLGTGVVLSDLGRRVLAPAQAARLRDLVGRRCGEVLAEHSFSPADLEWFFEQGLLALEEATAP